MRRNEAFIAPSVIGDIGTNFVHFRYVESREKRDLIDRDEGIYNDQFLDGEIETKDFPQRQWFLQQDTTNTVVFVRNLLWEGYLHFTKKNTNLFGSVYFGYGICNQDFCF